MNPCAYAHMNTHVCATHNVFKEFGLFLGIQNVLSSRNISVCNLIQSYGTQSTTNHIHYTGTTTRGACLCKITLCAFKNDKVAKHISQNIQIDKWYIVVLYLNLAILHLQSQRPRFCFMCFSASRKDHQH